MLHILGMILKIAGILLGSILGICLLLLFLVTFVPVRYRVKSAYHGRPEIDARITWLFPVLTIRILYEGEKCSIAARILGQKLEKRQKAVLFREPDGEQRKELPLPDEAYEKPDEDMTLQDESGAMPYTAARRSERASITQKLRAVLEKIKCTIHHICDKIKMLTQKREQLHSFLWDEKNREALRLIKEQLIYLWKHSRPRRFSLACRFGFDDPSLTGQVLAVCAIFYPYYRNTIRLYPDFENRVLDADGYIRGKVRGFSILVLVIRLWRNEQIKRMIYQFRK